MVHIVHVGLRIRVQLAVTEHSINLWNILTHVLALREVMDELNPM
jgi:hypothetical protein